MFTRFLFTILALCVSVPALAAPYKLTVGDRITIDYDLLEAPKTVAIDMDGNIRLARFGNVNAMGKNLDEVEDEISKVMISGGFSGVPVVSVEISEYARVVVSGSVESPGLYDYVPGMTLGVALALSGGPSVGETLGDNTEIATLNARRRAGNLAEEIARVTARIAMLTAALEAEDTPISLDDSLRAQVPKEQQATLETYIASEAKILEAEREMRSMLRESWQKEISDNEEQIEVMDKRIVVLDGLVKELEAELEDVRSLQERGLTTSNRASSLSQRVASEREDLLAIETAKVVSRRARSVAERNLEQYESQQYQDRLSSLRDSRSQLATLQRDYRSALNELLVLGEDAASLEMLDTSLELGFSLLGPRADRIAPSDLTLNTLLLPGDIIVAEPVPANISNGG